MSHFEAFLQESEAPLLLDLEDDMTGHDSPSNKDIREYKPNCTGEGDIWTSKIGSVVALISHGCCELFLDVKAEDNTHQFGEDVWARGRSE